MQSFGNFAILLAFVLCWYALLAGIAGQLFRNERLAASAQRASLAVFPAVAAATLSLVGLVLRNDFSVSYVAEHSNRALPWFYKVSVLWSGQEGSLLFWSLLLSGYAFVVLLSTSKAHRHLRPTVAIILSSVQAFFLTLNVFVASPFITTPVGVPADGSGLNPLLQYFEMVVHPPMLYLGYVGFSVPFAFALAALIHRYPGDRWIQITRRWAMIAWGFLTVGIVLGGHWAYTVLGWGGYWAWDPVENAAFLPWLMGTAFLHSVMMQEKRGMLKIWNVWLVFATFLLSIFGTFLTRSGVVSSVHAFAQSSIGTWFVVFLGLALLVCIVAFLLNRDFLKSENTLESTLSRESGFLFNNFVLLVAVFAILWGTLFPVLSEWIQGQKITVGREFFDRINVPIFLFLLFLTGVGPLLAWRRTSFNSLRRNFLLPACAAVALFVALFAFGMRDLYPMMAFSLGLFVVTTIGSEFLRGARVIAGRTGRNLLSAIGYLTMRNTRRYGGYVIHLGIVLIGIGLAGSGFNKDVEAPMPYHAHMQIGPYTLNSLARSENDNDNYSSESLIVQVFRNGQPYTTMFPARRFYKASNQPESMVAIHSTPLEDLYLVYEGDDQTTQQPILRAYLNPLVSWIWYGTIVVAFGIGIALLPSRKADSSPQIRPALANEEVALAH